MNATGSARFRRSLLRQLLRAASLPTATLTITALFSGCGQGEVRCAFMGDENGQAPAECPPAEEVTHVPVDCTEVLESVDAFSHQDGTRCCYEVTIDQQPEEACVIEGRPLMIDEAVVKANAMDDDGWLQPVAVPDLDGLDDDERAALAAMWTEAALAEHASIASFARNALELMAHGAPRRLVEEAQRAGLDEVRHASMSFAMASLYAGRAIGPTELPLPSALPLTQSLKELAVSTAIEACLNETLAVIVASEQAAHASDPAVRKLLKQIIADEVRHAALAWLTVRWAIRRGGDEVRDAVTSALQDAAPSFEPSGVSAQNPRLAAHGLLDDATRRDAFVQGYREVIRPAMAALLADDAVSPAVGPAAAHA